MSQPTRNGDGVPKVGVVGTGYVGLTTAVCLAERADVVAVDTDVAKLEQLNAGIAGISEPNLEDELRGCLARGSLRLTPSYGELADRDLVFVCVPTPRGADGGADLSAVDDALGHLGQVLRAGAVVCLKSTVPVGTTRTADDRLRRSGIRVVSTPEFLREGHAVHDFKRPDRVVIGTCDAAAARAVRRVLGENCPTLVMGPESSELSKYASNAFLALKLSYVNRLAQLCSRVGADIGEVTRCMAADDRIGAEFLQPGPGWGGSCLPKDTAALVYTAQRVGLALPEVEASISTNSAQIPRLLDAIRRAVRRPLRSSRIAVLGLTFKAGTSDVRDSPTIALCAQLTRAGAYVSGYDPELQMIDKDAFTAHRVVLVDDPYLAVKAADVIAILVEWPEFRRLDWQLMAQYAPGAIVLDSRNLLRPATIRRFGFGYLPNGAASGF
jgi:UDPglucose 6-dehydrogenase